MVTEANTRILIVDDEEPLRRMMARWLQREQYHCEQAASSEQAWEIMQHTSFSLVILDIMMTGVSGLVLLGQIAEQFPDTAVIMVTGVDDRATAIDALHLGASGYLIKPFDMNELLIDIVNALERRRLILERNQYESELEEIIFERTAEIRATQEEVTLTLTAAMQQRHGETGAHIKRIGLYSMVLAKALDWTDLDAETIRLAAPMHDIGKIGVPDSVLLKPGKLTDDEFAAIAQHTVIGANILADATSALLQLARSIALSHHEKWDGSGYPYGVCGDAIPVSAQIVAVVDVYDALTHDRVYRKAYPEMVALAMMREGRGAHFSPLIFDIFMRCLPQLRAIGDDLRCD